MHDLESFQSYCHLPSINVLQMLGNRFVKNSSFLLCGRAISSWMKPIFLTYIEGVINDTWCKPKTNVSVELSSPLVEDALSGELVPDRCNMYTNYTDSNSTSPTVRCMYGQEYDRAGFWEKGTMTMEVKNIISY